MDEHEFVELLDRYGGDLNAWPAGLQETAAALMADSSAARRHFLDVGEIEHVLRATKPRDVPEMNAILARATRHPQARPVNRIILRSGWAAAFAAVMLLGFSIGEISSAHEDGPERVMKAAFAPMESTDVD